MEGCELYCQNMDFTDPFSRILEITNSLYEDIKKGNISGNAGWKERYCERCRAITPNPIMRTPSSSCSRTWAGGNGRRVGRVRCGGVSIHTIALSITNYYNYIIELMEV